MNREQLDRALLVATSLLVVAACASLLLGLSEPEVAPADPFVVEHSADAAPPIRAARPMPDRPQAPPSGALLERESGLKTWDIQPGQGEPPREGQVVAVDYVGWLENGIAVDTTFGGYDPRRFVVGAGTILRGLDEAVREMRVGGQRQLVVPPALAFGEAGVLNRVPRNATLTYEMRLVGIWNVPETPAAVQESDWVSRPRGIRIADVEVGRGPKVKPSQTLFIDYAMYADGKLASHSFDKPAPMKLALGTGQLLDGWERGMQGMRVGSHRRIELPPEEAFGAEGRGEEIGPNANITVEVIVRRAR